MSKLKLIAVFVVVLLFPVSCSSIAPVEVTHAKRAVIFIPGFKGSTLRDVETNKTIWITAYQALFGSSSLRYSNTKLVPDGVLNRVDIIPGIYSLNVYQTFLESLQKRLSPDTLLVPFSYDWREDNFQHVLKLADLVRDLKSQGIDDISIIAHSMGGLIAAYYLRYGNQAPELAKEDWQGAKDIRAVVIVATPFKGALLMFHDFLKGIKTLRNTSLLSAEALQSFPSCYQLLPRHDTPIVLNEHLRTADVDFYNKKFWTKNYFTKY